MKSGRELDALVAEKVMGWTCIQFNGGPLWCDPKQEVSLIRSPKGCSPFPPYSTDISAAWEVAEKFKGFTVERSGAGMWWAGFLEPKDVLSCAETAPLAICLAALKAVGYENKS